MEPIKSRNERTKTIGALSFFGACLVIGASAGYNIREAMQTQGDRDGGELQKS